MLGRSNGQRELNPFLFPPPFWPLLFWVLVRICENGTRLRVAAWTKDEFKSGKIIVELIYLFPRELWHTAQATLINVLRTIKMCLSLEINVLVKSTVSTLFIFLLYLSSMCYTPPPYSSWDRSSVRLIISYGVSTPADATMVFQKEEFNVKES